MIMAYWQIGKEIVEQEQRGQKRAEYKKSLLNQLSKSLSIEFGPGYSVSNLRMIRQFFLSYRDRRPGLYSSADGEVESLPENDRKRHSPPRLYASTPDDDKKQHSLSVESATLPTYPFLPELSWTHYRVLMRIIDPAKRNFYEVECSKARWSVRELERQISSLLFERLAKSRDKKGVMALAHKGHDVYQPEDLIKDPYVLEFTGLPDASIWQEGDLEQALINRLQNFLLELGKDLFFVARQKRITLDGDHFYIDLVFYHRILRCFLLIDLKVGKLTQADIGQMLLYTGYYEAEEQFKDENPPIGLILCTDKNDAVVRYTLSNSAKKIFASRYQLHLPSEEELSCELIREREDIERNNSEEE
jgi:predicted nuclease of restriction endonuclease-like (RecB) superfamily